MLLKNRYIPLVFSLYEKAQKSAISSRNSAYFLMRIFLDYGECEAVDFLIHIQCIDVGHAGNVIDHCHESRLEVGGVNVVLAADALEQLPGIEPVGVDGSLDEGLHQCGHDFITAQFHIKHHFRGIDSLLGNFLATLVGFQSGRVDAVNQALPELAGENFLLVVDEGVNTFFFQESNHAGAEIIHLFVDVVYLLFFDSCKDAIFAGFIEKTEQKFTCLFIGDKPFSLCASSMSIIS